METARKIVQLETGTQISVDSSGDSDAEKRETLRVRRILAQLGFSSFSGAYLCFVNQFVLLTHWPGICLVMRCSYMSLVLCMQQQHQISRTTQMRFVDIPRSAVFNSAKLAYRLWQSHQ